MLCRACNRRLTDPESIALGIGPVCALRLGIGRVKAKRAPRIISGRRMKTDPNQMDWIGATS